MTTNKKTKNIKAAKRPPKFAEKLLELFSREGNRPYLLGDLEEDYGNISRDKGTVYALLWYWYQTLRAVPDFVRNQIFWSMNMFKNYLRLSFRYFRKHKLYSFINFLGLSIGLTAGILILLYVRHEFNYDKFHKNPEDIYRVILEHPIRFGQYKTFMDSTPPAMGPAMAEEFPEIESFSRVDRGPLLLSINNKSFKTKKFKYVDEDFLSIFNFSLKYGNIESVLAEPYSIVLTEEAASKYFGDDEPLGKTITADGDNIFTVTGVLEDLPSNSFFDFEILGSMSSLESINGAGSLNKWGNIRYQLFVRLIDNADTEDLAAKLPEFIERHGYHGNPKDRFFYQPIEEVHLYGTDLELAGNQNVRNLFTYTGIALFMMLIACINYMNLATARASIRIKEVGMRKVLGAKRSELFKQFMLESFLVTGIAFVISVFAAYLFLPYLNEILVRKIDFQTIFSREMILGITSLLIFTSFAAGSYPALILSAFKPEAMLKNSLFKRSRTNLFTRNSLVVFQYAISVFLIVSTLVVYKQINFLQNVDPGFNKDSVINLRFADESLKSMAFQNELLSHPNIEKITASNGYPSQNWGADLPSWEGQSEDQKETMFRNLEIDKDFLDFYEIPITMGEDFTNISLSSEKKSYMINETALKAMGWDDPFGKKFQDGIIVGVIKDFNYSSMKNQIKPVMISQVKKEKAYFISLKINPENTEQTIEHIKTIWEKFSTVYPFEYSFLDERLANMYVTEGKLGKSLTICTILTLIIASLGLFGLASFMVEQKIREIGIRKVLGAPISNIVYMLSFEFIKWIVLSSIIGFFVSEYVMKLWLDNYPYKAEIGVKTYMLALIAAIILALCTVASQTLKAAYANPVNSLRHE